MVSAPPGYSMYLLASVAIERRTPTGRRAARAACSRAYTEGTALDARDDFVLTLRKALWLVARH